MAEPVPPPEGEESPLARARRRLYAAAQSQGMPAAGPSTTPAQTSTGWAPEAAPKRRLPLTAWFFVVALGFFVIAGLVAGLILLLGGRSVGNDRMSITFEGPIAVDGGETVPLDVIVRNGNPATASDLTLSIDFPPEAYDPETMKPLGHYTAKLPDLGSGAEARQGLTVVFYGAENERLSIPVSLSYRTPESRAVFEKDATRDTTITTAPVSIVVTALPEASSGQRFSVSASVRSNAPQTLHNVALKAEYPFGFSVLSADPQPIGANVFPLGDLAPGEDADVRITGILTGQDGDERVFRFQGGVLPDPEAVALAEPAYTRADHSVKLTRSFLSANLMLNQQNGDIVAKGGDTVQASVSWTNTLADTIADGEVRVALTGEAIDYGSVEVANGFYRSSDHTVVFDETNDPSLRSLVAGESGAGAFSFRLRSADALASSKGAVGTLTVSVSGRRVADEGREESLTSTIVRTVKAATDLALEASTLHSSGQLENSGPVPPIANQETTYTVKWSVSNNFNSVANAQVTATLPSYVRFTNATNASGAVTYNDTMRQVTWSIGDIVAGTDRETEFQVAFVPSTSQKGSAPTLIQDQKLTGFDRFVQADITDEAPPLTTEMPDDIHFQSGDGRVE